MKRHRLVAVIFVWVVCAGAAARAQETDPGAAALKPPQSDRLRIGVSFLAAYGADKSQESLGLENQGRVGYAIVRLSGKLNDRFAWFFEFNPVNETQPLPSCGEPRYFYPNTPQAFGPNVACDNDGRLRVDDYRFLALDLYGQQGPLRQAFGEWTAAVPVRASTGSARTDAPSPVRPELVEGRTASLPAWAVRFGRFILPIGFDAAETGSFTAKDAPHIQRINAEANFGAMITARRARGGRPLVEGHLAAFLGDGNRFHDYDYYYSMDSSLDTNSALTALVSGRVFPVPGADLRGAFKWGYTGSKVETLPNFYASKRNDRALVFSAQYRRTIQRFSVRAFGELAAYDWGPTETSAQMLGLPTDPIHKNGYYAGAGAAYQVNRVVRVGVNATREELSRDDSLIEYLALQGLYDIVPGKKERAFVWRVYADIGGLVTVGFYRNSLQNPFPWVSGIVPVEGPNAFGAWGRGNDKWGLVLRFALE